MNKIQKISLIFMALALVVSVFFLVFNQIKVNKEVEIIKNSGRIAYYDDSNTTASSSKNMKADTGDSARSFSDLPMWDKMNVVFADRKMPKSKDELLDFCLNGFDFSKTYEMFLARYSEINKNNYYRITADRIVFLEKITKGENYTCKEGDSKEFCENANFSKAIPDFLFDRNKDFCKQFGKNADEACAIFSSAKANKKIILNNDTEKTICSVDKGIVGENIKYYIDGNNESRECQSDSGHIFNIILAYANNDTSYCSNIKNTDHAVYRDLCNIMADKDNLEKEKDDFKKDFCSKFTELSQ